MKQSHKILLNRYFTGNTNASLIVSPENLLQYEDKYYSYSSGENAQLVDFSNVRSFLSNKNNQKIVQLYYTFLSSSPLMNSALLIDQYTTQFIPTAEFKTIYYDDERLAESFNNFYSTSILRGIDSSYTSNPDVFNTSIRNQLLSGTDYTFTSQSVSHNYYFWSSSTPSNPAYSPPKKPFFTAGTSCYYTTPVLDVYGGDRNTETEERFVEIPSDIENYFINVFLTKRFTQTSRISFEMCPNVIYKILNSQVIFSQSLADIAKYNDFLDFIKKTVPQSIDKSPIKDVNTNSFSILESISRTAQTSEETSNSKSLIQCFVNPNFKTNENEVWNDNFFNIINPLVIEEMEELQRIDDEGSQTTNIEDVQLENVITISNIEANELTSVSSEEPTENDDSETEPDNSHPESQEEGWV